MCSSPTPDAIRLGGSITLVAITIITFVSTSLAIKALCHWSSTRRLPQVTATDDGHLEITLFPVDANHVTDIERVVRRALG